MNDKSGNEKKFYILVTRKINFKVQSKIIMKYKQALIRVSKV